MIYAITRHAMYSVADGVMCCIPEGSVVRGRGIHQEQGIAFSGESVFWEELLDVSGPNGFTRSFVSIGCDVRLLTPLEHLALCAE